MRGSRWQPRRCEEPNPLPARLTASFCRRLVPHSIKDKRVVGGHVARRAVADKRAPTLVPAATRSCRGHSYYSPSLHASSVCCSVLAARLVLTGCCAAQFDITFPALPCEWLSLDAMDISGEMHLDVVRDTAGRLGHHACDLAPYCCDLVDVFPQVGCVALLSTCCCAGSRRIQAAVG